MSYNGHKNYETWLASVHGFGDDTDAAWEAYDSAEACRTFTRRENAVFALAETLESHADDMLEADAQNNPFLADLLRSALSEVDWREIAAGAVDGMLHLGQGLEVFHAEAGEAGEDSDGEPMPEGWYWWACQPGCLPDGDPMGPFDTEDDAIFDTL